MRAARRGPLRRRRRRLGDRLPDSIRHIYPVVVAIDAGGRRAAAPRGRPGGRRGRRRRPPRAARRSRGLLSRAGPGVAPPRPGRPVRAHAPPYDPAEEPARHDDAVLRLGRPADARPLGARPQGHLPRAQRGRADVRRRRRCSSRRTARSRCARSRRSTTSSGSPRSGRYNEFENLRRAGIRYADVQGYSYDRRDVSGRALANAYAQILGASFIEQQKPFEVELCVGAVGETPDRDQLFRITYDGSISDEPQFVVMGGTTEPVSAALRSSYEEGLDTRAALGIALDALAGPERLGVELARPRPRRPRSAPWASTPSRSPCSTARAAAAGRSGGCPGRRWPSCCPPPPPRRPSPSRPATPAPGTRSPARAARTPESPAVPTGSPSTPATARCWRPTSGRRRSLTRGRRRSPG